MSLSTTDQALQLAAWGIALIEAIIGLYILVFNPWHTANRAVGGMLLLFATNQVAMGSMIGATGVFEAALPSYVLAATVPAFMPAVLLVTLVLLKPAWLAGRWRGGLWLIYLLAVVPALLTVVDVWSGTHWFYSGLDPETYIGGFVATRSYSQGTLAPALRVPFYLCALAVLLTTLYVAVIDKTSRPLIRRLAWLLLGSVVVASLGEIWGHRWISMTVATLISNSAFVAAYGYAAFAEMISERRLQRGSLQVRLTALMAAIAAPLLFAVVTLIGVQAQGLLRQEAQAHLSAITEGVASTTSTWLALNVQALQQLAAQPAVQSMDPVQQKPLLQSMAQAYPHMYLVSTTDLNGMNVARSDAEAAKDYGDRAWFQEAKAGAPVSYQSLVSRTTGQPALVVSVPIRDGSGTPVGVAMFGSTLADIAYQVQLHKVGETGQIYVIDNLNQIVAHSDPAQAAELTDLSASPPVAALRRGESGLTTFVDGGYHWQAHTRVLDNGWGIVVQQHQTEVLKGMLTLQRASWIVLAAGVILLLVLSTASVRQAVRPVRDITRVAAAVAGGDLHQEAQAESEDEVGALAQAFNAMTAQLRELVASLEQRVAQRTADLEARSRYLQASAEVGRAVTSILDVEALSRQVVDLIRDHFGLYYVGLFLVDENGEWAVLRAGTGEAGRVMLARGHRIHIGEGMIGWSIAHVQARVSQEAERDTVRLTMPELPGTRSEAALPLRSRGRMLGALTVQSDRPQAFESDTLAALQAMADQVAVALDNARLFTEKEAALESTRQAYGQMSREAWGELLHSRRAWGYRYAGQAVSAAEGAWQAEMIRAAETGETVAGNGGEEAVLAVPLKVRDQVVGALSLRKKEPARAGWSDEELALLQAVVDQVGAALESARLYQDSQRRAAQERLTGDVTARIRETLDVDVVLQTAVRELRHALGMAEVQVHLDPSKIRTTHTGGSHA